MSVATLMVLTGCTLPKFEDADADAEIPVEERTFRVHEVSEKLSVLLAPEGEKATGVDLVGTVGSVGGCLGVKDTDEGNLTVLWPVDTLVLQKKTGVEFRSINDENRVTRTRLTDGAPVVLTGSFVTSAAWFDQVPENCEIPEQGVFVVQNALHPAPEAEEEAENSEDK